MEGVPDFLAPGLLLISLLPKIGTDASVKVSRMKGWLHTSPTCTLLARDLDVLDILSPDIGTLALKYKWNLSIPLSPSGQQMFGVSAQLSKQ